MALLCGSEWLWNIQRYSILSSGTSYIRKIAFYVKELYAKTFFNYTKNRGMPIAYQFFERHFLKATLEHENENSLIC